MDKSNIPPSETRYDDLIGVVSVNFKEEQNFNALAAEITDFDSLRYEAVALRVFIHEFHAIVTLYAMDREKQQLSLKNEKLLVKKFKQEMKFEDLFRKFKNLNFTLTSQEYKLEDLEVVE